MASSRFGSPCEEFAHEVEGWLPVLPEVFLPRLSGSLLADVAHRKLPVSWFLAFCLVSWILGFGLMACLMLTLL